MQPSRTLPSWSACCTPCIPDTVAVICTLTLKCKHGMHDGRTSCTSYSQGAQEPPRTPTPRFGPPQFKPRLCPFGARYRRPSALAPDHAASPSTAEPHGCGERKTQKLHSIAAIGTLSGTPPPVQHPPRPPPPPLAAAAPLRTCWQQCLLHSSAAHVNAHSIPRTAPRPSHQSPTPAACGQTPRTPPPPRLRSSRSRSGSPGAPRRCAAGTAAAAPTPG